MEVEKLQTYQEVNAYIKTQKRDRHLLLGNGFSMSYDPDGADMFPQRIARISKPDRSDMSPQRIARISNPCPQRQEKNERF
jgi:pantothenate synthetase